MGFRGVLIRDSWMIFRWKWHFFVRVWCFKWWFYYRVVDAYFSVLDCHPFWILLPHLLVIPCKHGYPIHAQAPKAPGGPGTAAPHSNRHRHDASNWCANLGWKGLCKGSVLVVVWLYIYMYIYIYISLFSRIHIHIQYTIYNINIYIIYIYILCIHVSLFLVSLFWLGIQPTWLYGTDTMLQRASGTRLKRLVGLVVCSPWQSWWRW